MSSCPTLPNAQKYRDKLLYDISTKIKIMIFSINIDRLALLALIEKIPDLIRPFIIGKFVQYIIQRPMAFTRDSYRERIIILCELCPDAVKVSDNDGMIALHHYANLETIYANMGAKSEGYDKDILTTLLSIYPQSPSVLNKYGETPLHIHASIDKPDSNTIHMMIEYCPESVRSFASLSKKLPIHMIMSLNRKCLKDCIDAAAVIIAAHPEAALLEVIDDRHILTIGTATSLGSNNRVRTIWSPYSRALEIGEEKILNAIEIALNKLALSRIQSQMSGHDIEPKSLVYRDVRLNQAYTSSICITNPLTASVEFTLRPSSPRYTITPSRINLNGGQSLVVSVRLFLSHYPNYSKGVRGQDDTIHIKSSYFEQKVDVTFFLHSRDSATIASTSRSLSPTMRSNRDNNLNSGIISYDPLSELQSQLYVKDNKIKELEGIIGQLESKYPSMQEIIRSRLEQERSVFEEKSEKVLKILRRKDETIGLLQEELQQQTNNAELRRKESSIKDQEKVNSEGKSHDYWSGSKVEQPSSESEIASLKQTIEDLKRRLQNEELIHNSCKNELRKTQEALEDLSEVQLKTRKDTNTSSTVHIGDHHQELKGLREKTLDQAEQIEVLVAEISKMRIVNSNAPTHEKLSAAQNEVHRLSQDLMIQNDKHKLLQDAYNSLEKQYISGEANHTPGKQGGVNLSPKGVSWGGAVDQNDRHFEYSVGGGLNTATPSKFESSQYISPPSALALYQERAENAEKERDLIREEMLECNEINNDLRQRCTELENRANSADREGRLLSERNERLRSEQEQNQLKIEEGDVLLKSVQQQMIIQGEKTNIHDSHLWWSYVWHELKRQSSERDGLSEKDAAMHIPASWNENRSSLDGTNHRQEAEANAQLTKLRDNLRAQAIELVTLRQDILGRKLTNSKELEMVKEQLDLCRREVIRMTALARTHKGDKEVKISEMAVTIRTLSARGDMHSQVASTRQDLEAEKLTVHHLRSDIDAYRNMLEAEQQKVLTLRKDLAASQANNDSMSVLRTVMDVPGVEPASLMEMMSGQIILLQKESNGVKGQLSQAQSQINSLTRSLSLAAKQKEQITKDGDHDVSEHGRRGLKSYGGRTMSPSTKQRSKLPVSAENDPINDAIAGLFGSYSPTSHNRSMLDNEPFSITIDGEATPSKVLESLDAAMLAQKVLTLETTIDEMRQRLEEMDDEVVRAEYARLSDREDYEGVARIELESSLRRQEILQMSLDEAKNEVNAMRQKMIDMEQTATFLQTTQIDGSSLNAVMMSNNVEDSASSVGGYQGNAVDNREELESTKSLLKERTTQLKIIMDTLDTLQIAGVKSRAVDENSDYNLRDNGFDDDLIYLASKPLPPMEGSWGVQALVKRVVEITTELTSQTALASLETRRSEQLEKESRSRSHEINRLKTLIKKNEDDCGTMQLNLQTLGSQVRDSEKLRAETTQKYQRENDELISTLRELESQRLSDQVTIEELNQKLQYDEQIDFQDWLDSVIFGGDKVNSRSCENDSNSSDNSNIDLNSIDSLAKPHVDEGVSVKSLVMQLLSQWREYVSNYPSRGTAPTISKVEQRFLQRISDLVLNANDRCTKSIAEQASAEIRRKQAEVALQITRERLKACVQHLHRYRKRAHASEKVISIDKKHQQNHHGRLASLLKKNLVVERNKLNETIDLLLKEKREKKKLELKQSIIAYENSKLQSKLAQLEAQGNSTLKGRQEAISSLDSKLKSTEESMRKWVRVELPRLISGIPISEELMSDYSTSYDYERDREIKTPVGNHLAFTMGLDKTFALSQALCESKTIQASQDIRILGIQEKNSILKEKLINLEGVLMKWKTEVECSRTAALLTDEEFNKKQLLMYRGLDEESKHIQTVSKLSIHNSNLEEEIVELKGRLETSGSRADEMKRLVDIIMKDEELLKTKATKQVTKIRVDLENEHANELRRLRETYESEIHILTDELEKVGNAVEEARMSTIGDNWKPNNDDGGGHLGGGGGDDDSNDGGEGGHLRNGYNNGNKQNEHHSRSWRQLSSELKSKISSHKKFDFEDKNEKKTSKKVKKTEDDAESSSSSDRDNGHDAGILESEIVKELTKKLETEQKRSKQSREDIEELELLLSVQRSTFSQKLDDRDQSKFQPIPLAFISNQTNNQQTNNQQTNNQQTNYQQTNNQQTNNQVNQNESLITLGTDHIIQEVMEEDSSLWPSLDGLVDELSNVLKTLPQRHKALASDNTLRTALSMTARIKVILDGSKKNKAYNNEDKYENLFRNNDVSESKGSHHAVKSLQSLSTRVRMIEADFSDENVPERHMLLLRDLRARMSEIEQTVVEDIDKQKQNFILEKEKIHLAFLEQKEETEALKAGQEANSILIKRRYEDAINQAQEALETQSTAANIQIERLEELLQKSQTEHYLLKKEIESGIHSKKSSQQQPLQQLKNMQTLVEKTTDELDETKIKAATMQSKHQQEMNEMRDQFTRYRRAQDEVDKSFEDELEQLKEITRMLSDSSNNPQNISSSGENDESADSGSLANAEDKIRKLEYRFRTKSSELEAVMRALEKTSENSDIETRNNFDQDNDNSDDSLNRNSRKNIQTSSVLSRGDVKSGLFEARIASAEKEIESLRMSLSKEKKINSSLRTNLQTVIERKGDDILGIPAAKTVSIDTSVQQQAQQARLLQGELPSNTDAFLKEISHEILLPEGEATREKLKNLVRKMNDIRKYSKGVILQQREKYSTLHTDLVAKQEEILKIKSILTDAKEQINTLREDNGRKSKLLSSLKAARTNEANSLDQWKEEAKEQEEIVKRLQRNISSKDALIRDLKSRVEGLEETRDKLEGERDERVSASGSPTKDQPTDIANLSAGELRNRLRTSELERSRSRVRLNSLKDRVTELDGENKIMKEELERISKSGERLEALKASNLRKDAVVKSLKAQLEKSRIEFEELRSEKDKDYTESDKKNRQLMRNLDIAEKKIVDIERESFLMRKRLTERETTSSSVDFGYRSRAPITTLSVPKSLGSSVGDITDIMHSLGGTTGGGVSVSNIDNDQTYGQSFGNIGNNSSSASISLIADRSGDESSSSSSVLSVEKRLQELVRSSLRDSPPKR